MRSTLIHVMMLVASVVAISLVVTPAQARPPLKYVALGDSYSAGSGVWPPTAPALCIRSTTNFAAIIAQVKKYRLVDGTCGAAKTSDFYHPQYPGLRPQLDYVTPDTRVVTLTIGGNDSAVFASAIATCTAAYLTQPFAFNPCERSAGKQLTAPIKRTTLPAITQVLNDIHRKAPRAQVYILAYPWITPASGSCIPQLPLAPGDIRFLHRLQGDLNNAVRTAAQRSGTHFVDTAAASVGHDACQAPGVRWVEPLALTTQFVPVHPNALGELKMARAVLDQLPS